MIDPLEALLSQGTPGDSSFAAQSRYRAVEIVRARLANSREVNCLARRILPPVPKGNLAMHLVAEGDRLDHLAHRYLGDPELFWKLCDVNYVLRPGDLTDALPGGAQRPAIQIDHREPSPAQGW